MADIFLSYSEKDRPLARCLAEQLQAFGWSVWWDRRIPAGRTWRSVLAQELEQMRCMVVLWSSHSVASEWVCEEANEGRQLGRLIPVSLEAVRPPAGFREIQAADLVGWKGDGEFAGLRQLLDDIAHLIGPPARQQQTAAVPAAPAPSAPPPAPLPAPPPAPAAQTAAAPPAVLEPSEVPAPQGQADASPVFSSPSHRVWVAGTALVALAVAGIYVGWGSRQPDRTPAPEPAHAAQQPRDSAPSTTSPTGPPNRPPGNTTTPAMARDPSTPPLPAPAAGPRAAETTAAAATATRPTTSRPTNPTGQANPRCAALLERATLGETLSADAQMFLRQECHR